jgi:hypothetical protein
MPARVFAYSTHQLTRAKAVPQARAKGLFRGFGRPLLVPPAEYEAGPKEMHETKIRQRQLI